MRALTRHPPVIQGALLVFACELSEIQSDLIHARNLSQTATLIRVLRPRYSTLECDSN